MEALCFIVLFFPIDGLTMFLSILCASLLLDISQPDKAKEKNAASMIMHSDLALRNFKHPFAPVEIVALFSVV